MAEINIQNDLSRGQKWEQYIADYFGPNKVLRTDGRQGDFIVVPSGMNHIAELKTDYWCNKTGNFAVELLGNIFYNKQGGPWKAKKDGCSEFWYLDPEECLLWRWNIDTFIAVVKDLVSIRRPEIIQVENKPRNGGSYWSLNYLIPMKDLIPHSFYQYRLI